MFICSVVSRHARESALTAVSLPIIVPNSIHVDPDKTSLHIVPGTTIIYVNDVIPIDGYTGKCINLYRYIMDSVNVSLYMCRFYL